VVAAAAQERGDDGEGEEGGEHARDGGWLHGARGGVRRSALQEKWRRD